MSFLILEKARREGDTLRLSPQAKEMMIASTKRNIKELGEAKSKIAGAISAAVEEVEDKIKAQKKLNAKAKKEGKEENINNEVNVLRQFFDLDESKKDIKDKAEEYVVSKLPRNARDLIMSELYESSKEMIDGYPVINLERTTEKIEDVIESIIEGEKKDIVRYEGAEESESEEIEEVVQEIGREKPRVKEVEDFINESYGEPRNFNNFSYENLVNALKAALMSGVFEREGQIKPEEQEEMATITEELQNNVSLASNILSRMSRDVDSLKNLRGALISISKEMKKHNRDTDDLEVQISAISERLEEFPAPSGPEITAKTLNKLKSIKKMLELLNKSKDEEMMVIEVLGRGNPAKNTFTELKNIAKNPQRVFYLGVPKGEDFLAPLGTMQKMTQGNRYNRPKEAGKEMDRYKELGTLGQEIHDLLNEKMDKELAAANEAIELELKEKEDKKMLAELRRSKEENTLLHLLRQVYRSMTGQVLDIGAGKELQRKFKEERAKRIKQIKEQRAQEDTPDPITEQEKERLRGRKPKPKSEPQPKKEIEPRTQYMKERQRKLKEREAGEEEE